MRRVAFVARVVAVVGLVTLAAVPPPAAAAGIVTGGGSSFAALEYNQWTADVSRTLKVQYTSVGSGFGRTAFLQGKIDFGVSDIQLQAEDQLVFRSSSRQRFVYVPTTAGGLAMAYSVVGSNGAKITNLRANQRNVCRLLTEEGMYWDDPELAAENPGVPLPHKLVARGQRAESAGETFLFSQFCIATAPDVWGRFVQLAASRPDSQASPELLRGEPMSVWPANTPTGTSAYNGADNLANGIQTGEGIAFMAYGYAKVRGIPVISVRNTAGVYLQPNPANVSVALAYALPRDDGTFKLDYVAKDPDAYFPSTYSYALAQTSGMDPGQGSVLAQFLYYSATQGQRRAEQLGYCRLSSEVVLLALSKASQIPGAPPPPTDLGGAPPPRQPIAAFVQPGSPLAQAGGGTSPAAKAAAAKAFAAAAAAAKTGSTATAGATSTTVAAADTGAGEVADGLALGADKLDMSKVAAAAPAATKTAAPGDDISNADTLWYFLLGFGMIAIGLGVGTATRGARGETS